MDKYKNAITQKLKGIEYDKESIEMFVLGYVQGIVSDELMTEWIKSIYDKGMSKEATAILTTVMMNSGDVIDLSSIEGIKVDKHSTGGVGDKISPIVGPIVASLGATVAKMSGRGLGFTGGTLDKLESIKGYDIIFDTEGFKNLLKTENMAIIGQSSNLVPADKLMYALRDETNLVDSLPLIASSIMSKKLATGADAILLDVKCGDAAFMKTEEAAIELGQTMIDLGKELNKDVRVEITSMETPLGRTIGNALEILEVAKFLKGEETSKDLKDVVYSSASTMLVQAGKYENEENASKAIDEVISNGKAFEKFNSWVSAQHGDPEFIWTKDFWNPEFKLEVKADKDGFMNISSASQFGILAMKLGAGRVHKEDSIDFHAGIYLDKKTGESVKKGETLFTLYSNKEINENLLLDIRNAYNIVDKRIEKQTILRKMR